MANLTFTGLNKVFYRPQQKLLKGNVFTSVCDSVHRGCVCVCMGHAWQGGHVWQEGVCMAGGMHGKGVCMTGDICGRGMHGRVCVWQGGMHGRGCTWQGACIMGGVCMAEEMATAVVGTHPTGMHSC